MTICCDFCFFSRKLIETQVGGEVITSTIYQVPTVDQELSESSAAFAVMRQAEARGREVILSHTSMVGAEPRGRLALPASSVCGPSHITPHHCLVQNDTASVKWKVSSM